MDNHIDLVGGNQPRATEVTPDADDEFAGRLTDAQFPDTSQDTEVTSLERVDAITHTARQSRGSAIARGGRNFGWGAWCR